MDWKGYRGIDVEWGWIGKDRGMDVKWEWIGKDRRMDVK